MNLTWIGGTHFCLTCQKPVTVKLVSPNKWVCIECSSKDIKRLKQGEVEFQTKGCT